MRKRGNIVSYTVEELDQLRAQGEDHTDWARVDAMTEEELEAAIASDPDWADIPADWYKDAKPGIPLPLPKACKRQVTLRLDPDILDHFRQQGRGWQSRINAVLRTFVEAQGRSRG